MVFTGANKPTDAATATMAVIAVSIAASPTAITKLIMKTGLEGNKKNKSQNYINRLLRDYNKMRQE